MFMSYTSLSVSESDVICTANQSTKTNLKN